MLHDHKAKRLSYLDREAEALYRQGEEFGDNAALVEAMAQYRALLAERTRDRVPLAWAATQTNLGIALTRLGARESGTARLEEAVAAYEAALEIFEAAHASYCASHTRDTLERAQALLQERGIKKEGKLSR